MLNKRLKDGSFWSMQGKECGMVEALQSVIVGRFHKGQRLTAQMAW